MRLRAAAAIALALALAGASAPARADRVADAFARARRENRAVVLEFRADWCGPCRWFEQNVLPDPRVATALPRLIYLQIDIDDPHGAIVAERHGVKVIPTFLSFDPSGQLIQRSIGIEEVSTPASFLAFFDRAEVGREFRGRARDPRAIRFAAEQADAVRRAPGTAAAGWALARALVAGGDLSAAELGALVELHAAHTGDQRLIAFTLYAALAGGMIDDAFALAERFVAHHGIDGAALAAAGHAYAEAGRLGEAYHILARCRDAARTHRERAACLTLTHRLIIGLRPSVIERIRHAVRLRVLAAIGARGASGDAAAERAAEDAVWGILPESILARERSARRLLPGRLWLRGGLVAASLGFRADRGLSDDGRFQVGGRALLTLRPGFEVKPMALVAAEAGMDFADELTYQGAAEVGFAAAGGILGIYSGISASDLGAGDDGALGIPIELALFFPGRRFGIEGFVRTTILFAGDEARRTGSNDAPLGSDELSLGLATQIPDTPILLGVRHDQLLDRTLTGIWLGLQLQP